MDNTVQVETVNDTDVSSEYIFELKTVQSSAFRILVEALKEILTDGNIEIDSSGLKIMTMDPSHTVLVHLKLDASKFESFTCPNKITIGVSMLCLFNFFFFDFPPLQRCTKHPGSQHESSEWRHSTVHSRRQKLYDVLFLE